MSITKDERDTEKQLRCKSSYAEGSVAVALKMVAMALPLKKDLTNKVGPSSSRFAWNMPVENA